MWLFSVLDVAVVVSPTQNGAPSSLFTAEPKGWAQLEMGDGWVDANNSALVDFKMGSVAKPEPWPVSCGPTSWVSPNVRPHFESARLCCSRRGAVNARVPAAPLSVVWSGWDGEPAGLKRGEITMMQTRLREPGQLCGLMRQRAGFGRCCPGGLLVGPALSLVVTPAESDVCRLWARTETRWFILAGAPWTPEPNLWWQK